MKVLVTGASGFLGRHTVQAFLARGHQVRALVRPASRTAALGWGPEVELHQADLRASRDLVSALQGVDVLVHLAATVAGDDETRFNSTVVGTERLLNAMAATSVRQLVLASSASVYDWRRARSVIDEQTPLASQDLYHRDSYAVSKVWQERVTRRMAAEHGWDLRVIRPGFIWGPGNEWLDCAGHRAGRFWAVIAPLARPPLTHVVNTADCFVTVTEHEKAAGQTYNVSDEHGISSWRYLGDYRHGSGARGFRLPIPYWAGLLAARTARGLSRLLFGPDGKLPSILVPLRFQARFRPIHYAADRVRRELGWRPPLDYRQCLEQTYRHPRALEGAGEVPHKVLNG